MDRLRHSLIETQTSLRQQLVGLDAAAQDTAVTLGNHMADDATAAFDQAAAVSFRRGHQVALDLVERALARMDAGIYGLCARCQQEIDFARLKAVPHAMLCMTCQRTAEL